MKPTFRKAVKTFKLLADSKMLTFGQKVTAAMLLAVKIYANPNPPLTEIDDELEVYEALLKTAATKDKVQVASKNESKKKIVKLLSRLVDYVNLTALGDLIALQASGMDLNKIPEPRHIKAATMLTLEDGDNSGEILFKFKGPRGVSSYMYQYTTDALLGETSWISIPGTATSFLFTGLNKSTTYYIRVVAVGTNQQAINSVVVNRICQ